MSLPDLAIPPAVVDKCFVQYLPDSPPSLHSNDPSSSSIRLAPGLLTTAVAAISGAFRAASRSSSPLVDSNGSTKYTALPVTAICSPHLNSLVPVDAAVRHIAHCVEADVVILDPAHLAAGRRGIFGEELTNAFWELYNYHYADDEVDDDDSEDKSEDSPFTHEMALVRLRERLEAELFSKTSPERGRRRRAPRKAMLHPEAEIEDPSFTRAKALVRRFLLMQSSVNTDAGTSVNRRRIIYLRDYGAVCKALLPLLPSLHEAASSGPPTLVVAGISPIQRVVLPGDNHEEANKKHMQHDRFLAQMKGDFLKYLHARYHATWRKPDSVERYQSLEHIFTAMFTNRYQGKGIAARLSADNTVPLRGSRPMKLRFARMVQVGLLHDPHLQVNSQMERQERFLLANLWLIHQHAALQDKSFKFDPTIDFGDKLDNDEDTTILTTLKSTVLDKKRLEHVANALPFSSDFKDALHVLRVSHEDMSGLEWREVLQNAKSGGPSKNSNVDTILASVRADRSLNKHEEQLLSCVVDPTTIRTTFADVNVQPEIMDTLKMSVMFPILYPEEYTTGILARESMGGVLLFGPPGTGKTMACRALAKESGARMLQLSASTLQDGAVGKTEKLISAAFSLARRLGPCIIFMDELDALFCKRDNDSRPWHRTMVTEFTQAMDGLTTADENQRAGLVVVATTNRPQDIDTAVLRRLPVRILLDLPTVNQRKGVPLLGPWRLYPSRRKHADSDAMAEIITQYLKDEQCDEKTVNVANLAYRTESFSGSDLRNLVVSAALAALKDNVSADVVPTHSRTRRCIQGKHFVQALKQLNASSATSRKDFDDLRRWAKKIQ